MEILKKFISRRLLVTYSFGIIAPVLFKTMNIDTNVALASIAMGVAYLGQRAVKG